MQTRRNSSHRPSGASSNVFLRYLSLTFSDLRKKMEEIAEQEKELARIEAMENALDVTKQDNMGGFYR